MDNTTKLRVMFDMVDNMTKPLQMMLTGNKGLAGSLKATRRELDDMAKTQKRIGEFREMRKGLANTASDLAAARARVDTLAQSLRATRSPSREMISDFNKAQRAAENLSSAHSYQAGRVQALRTQLAGAGIDTRNLSRDERNLRAAMASRTSMIDAGVRGYDAQRQQRADARRARIDALQGVGEKIAKRGQAVKGLGKDMFGMLSEPLDLAKQAESETLRMRAAGASADAVKFARAQQAYGLSTVDNLGLMRESLSAVGGDEQRARAIMPMLENMKFANEALFGKEDAKKNVDQIMGMVKVIDLRGGTKDGAAFRAEADIVQKMQTATGGKVSSDEWNNFAESGGAAAKKLRTDAFYYQMQPLIEKLGGKSAGAGLAALNASALQGKATGPAAQRMMALGLVDPKRAHNNKNVALVGGDMLQASPLEWLEKVLLPKLAAKGITSPDKVKAELAKLFPDKDAGNLLTTMYEKREQIHDTEKQSAAADGVDGMKAKGMESTHGRELAALAQVRDLKLEIGERVTPIYNKALDLTATAIGKIVGFMREHRTAANVIVTTLAVLAGLFVVVGTLASAFGAVLGSIAVLRFAMSMVSAFSMVGQALLALVALNPVVAVIVGVIAALAIGAVYLWQNWDTLGPKFFALWDGIKGAFSAASDWIAAKWNATVEWVKGALAGISDWFGNLGTRFMELGGNLISALIGGITNRLGALKDTIGNLGSSALGWLKEKLGLQSPDASAGNGAAGGQGRMALTAATITTAAALAGPPAYAANPSATAASPLARFNTSLDYRPPVMAPAFAAASAAPASGPVTINVTPPPGADEAEVARLVRVQWERAERERASRANSRLSD
ncbi:hypothetical protein [Burkholderia ubonensis]|uniref:Phage tail protein n=1 Tax=Burkholderia ubonensis TaxID=101571 RepID=A0A125GAN6_9BURK|nr:hypothetical protein [Burkholderia ubonensis]KWD75366.1 hypothetical protein WL70_26235 [Burkholderia ubonensis]KWD85419.1 hypothetical protein WL71_13955 [Burkholderia ubonensis]KWE02466.1 hypothetical protein WL72_05435 [Burkholderia ubonensis]KWE09255.1 hypothetical protein WL73_06000 [Burkholderia ubonensis]